MLILGGDLRAGERPAEIVVNVRCETNGCFASRIAYTSSPRTDGKLAIKMTG